MTTYEKVKAWRALNKDKVAEQSIRYRTRHPETHEKARQKYRELHGDEIRKREAAAKRKRALADPEKQKLRYVKWREKKEAQLAEQAGRKRPDSCELCGDAQTRIVFDHCHFTGKFRGWLCDRCNRVLGIVKEDVKLLQSLVFYLETHNGNIDN